MTDKQPKALWLADELEKYTYDFEWHSTAADELRRLHEVNAEFVEIFKRIRFEQGFACECGIEDATWGLIESAIAKFTGK
jgi:hypothetical protein